MTSPRRTRPERETLLTVGALVTQIPRAGDGFPTPELAEHWRPRGCGIACLRMVLAAHNVEHGTYWALINAGVDAGAYCDRGWIHQGLVDLAAAHGVPGVAHRRRIIDDLADEIDNHCLVIASVTVCFRGGQPHPGTGTYPRGGHLVLVTGARWATGGDPAVAELRVHHPSATEANNLANHWVPRDRFEASFSGNYMTFPTRPEHP